MAVNATSSTTNDSTAAAAALFSSINAQGAKANATDSTEFAKNRFLTLLTAQLKNQDPLNPMDNAQMTSQMAQISTVDGIERLNATLNKLIENSNESQTMQLAGLVGHGVLVPGERMELRDSGAIAGLTLGKPADEVSVEIYDSNGVLMRTLSLGALEAGSQAFGWDGLTNAGERAANGNYKFVVNAKLGGKALDAERLQFGMVDGVVRTSSGVMVSVGNFGNFTTNDIKQIL